MKIYLSNTDLNSFTELLKNNEIKFTQRISFRDSVDGGAYQLFLEIVHEKAAWGALAYIVSTYIKAHHGRSVTIKQGQKTTNIKGITAGELANQLKSTDSLTIESQQDEKDAFKQTTLKSHNNAKL
jgi:hypothetical protein